MAVSHVYSNTNADATGTLTIWNGATTSTVAASNLVKPSDWNSAHNQLSTIGGNTSGNSTLSGTNIVLQGSNHITLVGTNTTNLVVQGPPRMSMYAPLQGQAESAGHQGNATMMFHPFTAGWDVQHDRIGFRMSFSGATNSTVSASMSQWFGLYSRSNSSLSLISSTSSSWAFTMSGTANSVSYIGVRDVTIPWTNTISAGQWWMGICNRTSTANAGTITQILASGPSLAHRGQFGVSSNSSDQPVPGFGRYSASTTAVPGSVAFSQIYAASATNASLLLRMPVWWVMSSSVTN